MEKTKGMICCTREPAPRILYADDELVQLLGYDSGSTEWNTLICSNLFFLIPAQDRTALLSQIAKPKCGDDPSPIKQALLKRDGTEIKMSGWMRVVCGDDGIQQLVFLLNPVANDPQIVLRSSNLCVQALRVSYDAIVEVDTALHNLRVAYRKHSLDQRLPTGVRINLEDAVELWQREYVTSEDKSASEIFRAQLLALEAEREGKAPQALLHMKTGENVALYFCIAVPVSDSCFLICLRRMGNDGGAGMDGNLVKQTKQAHKVSMRTFGFFDVFVDGEPIAFSNEKAKEMLAVLVDRRGGFVDNSYMISCLWEEEAISKTVQNRCRQTAFRLHQILERYGVADIIESVNGKRRVCLQKVNCDYFDFLSQDRQSRPPYPGGYLLNYSWAETTAAFLAATSC